MSTNNKIKGLQAKIESAYYLKDKNGNRLAFSDSNAAYEYIKSYVNSVKDENDIIIFDDEAQSVIINTVNRQLALDRYVWINPANVNINDLSSNINRKK